MSERRGDQTFGLDLAGAAVAAPGPYRLGLHGADRLGDGLVVGRGDQVGHLRVGNAQATLTDLGAEKVRSNPVLRSDRPAVITKSVPSPG